MGDQIRQLIHFHIEQILHLPVGKFTQVKESERAPLWLRRGGNPGGELLGIELRNSCYRVRRDRFLRQRRGFGLHVVLCALEAAMARLMESPETVRREVPVRGEERGLAQCILKRLNRARRIPGHEKAVAIELRQTLRENVTPFFFQANKL